MAKHAYVVYRMAVTKNRNPDDYLDVGNIDSKNIDLLHLIHGFLNDLQGKAFRDDRYGQYLGIHRLAPQGRSIRFLADYGRFGTTGELVDIHSGVTTHEFDEDESPVSRTRNMVVSPPAGQSSLFLAERYGGRGAASMLLSQLKRAFRRRFDSADLILKHEGLIDVDDWYDYIKRAQMTSIEIKRFGPSSDVTDQTLAKSIGKVTSTIKPSWGEGIFSRAVRDRLINGEIRAQQMIGMSVDDSDEVNAVLDDGVQQRRMLIGESKIPMLSYQISADGDHRPEDGRVWEAMRAKVAEVNNKLRLRLPHDWEVGQWPKEALDVKLDAARDS